MKFINILLFLFATCSALAQNTQEAKLKEDMNKEIDTWCNTIKDLPFSKFSDENFHKDWECVIDINRKYKLNNQYLFQLSQDYSIYNNALNILKKKYNKEEVNACREKISLIVNKYNGKKKDELNDIEQNLKWFGYAVDMMNEIIDDVDNTIKSTTDSNNKWPAIQEVIKKYEKENYLKVFSFYEWINNTYDKYYSLLLSIHKDKIIIRKDELETLKTEFKNIWKTVNLKEYENEN